ncbi:MAG TPA: hypothetical protein VFH95_11650 [Candidatus Kapabacteria bacterium]|nr:hypothetical protein [Candidatus Kapabacteria bacterium]
MKILRIPDALFLSSALASVLILGCKSNSTSPGSVPPSIPTPGSAFTMMWYGGYSQTDYDTVAAAWLADPAHSGSKVIKLLKTTNGQTDSTFQSFETNGDVAVMGSSWGDPASFEVLPFVSQSPVNSSFTGAGGLVSISAVGNGAGKPFVLNGTSYATDSATVFSINSNDTDQFHYAYIPTLGLICTENYQPGSSSVVPSSRWLIAYTPK